MVSTFLLPREILDYLSVFCVDADDYSRPLFDFYSIPFALMTIALVGAVFWLVQIPCGNGSDLLAVTLSHT